MEASYIPISFIAGVYNEESRIRFTIEHAICWADEVVILNKSSTDRTREICLAYGERVRVVDVPFTPRGHDDVIAYSKIPRHDWIFFGTASEIPTRKLIAVIRQVLAKTRGELDLVYVPRKYYSFGIHDPRSPWSWSYFPFLINRKKAIIRNQIHFNYAPRDPQNTLAIPYADDCCVYHFTHTTAEDYLRAMTDYFVAEAATCADPDARIRECFQNIALFEERLRAAGEPLLGHYLAWPIYWLGTALFLWEKKRGFDVRRYYRELMTKVLRDEWQADLAQALSTSGDSVPGAPSGSGASQRQLDSSAVIRIAGEPARAREGAQAGVRSAHPQEEGFVSVQEPESRYLVTAIVSVYKAERYLRGCLEDLEAQTIADRLEIIVVDSGSPQDERAIVEEFQRRYDNILYVRTPRREGVYAAWNRGIKLASGKYLTNANADDRHRHDALERMVDVLEARPEVALVYANAYITETPNETFDRHTRVGAFRWHDFDAAVLREMCFVGPQPMWRRSLHARYGYFDESFESAGDWEFWLRLAQREIFYHLDEFLGLYLKAPTGIEHSDPERAAREAERVRARYGAPTRPAPAAPVLARSASVSAAASAPPTPAQVQAAIERILAPGRAALERGDLEEAARAFGEVTQRHPDLAAGYTALGSTLMALGRAVEAVPALRRAVELAPGVASLHNQLGSALHLAGDLAGAEAVFVDALSLDDQDVTARLNLAELYRIQRRYDLATAMIKEALMLDGNRVETLLAFGVICLELGDREGAQMALERIRAHHGDHPAARHLQEKLLDGASSSGNDSSETEATQRALALIQAALAPGRMALERGDLEAAVHEFARVAERYPDLSAGYTALGSTLMALGRYAEAVPALQRAMELTPQVPGLAEQLAEARQRAG